MPVYPAAKWRPLPENAMQPSITPTQIILHTAIDGPNTTSLYGWFDGGTNLESHFYVTKSGGVEQYMDTNVRADANNRANNRAISIETWDGRASGGPATPWNEAQLSTLIELIRWLCDVHGIPKRVCPAWDQPGIGWHNQFPEWSPGPTGCPGPLRAGQVRDVVVPSLISTPVPPITPSRRDPTVFKLTNPDGRKELLALSPDGTFISNWETAPGSGYQPTWAAVFPASAPKFSGINAEVASDGRLVATLVGPMGVIYGTWQVAPGAGPWVLLSQEELRALGAKK